MKENNDTTHSIILKEEKLSIVNRRLLRGLIIGVSVVIVIVLIVLSFFWADAGRQKKADQFLAKLEQRLPEGERLDADALAGYLLAVKDVYFGYGYDIEAEDSLIYVFYFVRESDADKYRLFWLSSREFRCIQKRKVVFVARKFPIEQLIEDLGFVYNPGE